MTGALGQVFVCSSFCVCVCQTHTPKDRLNALLIHSHTIFLTRQHCLGLSTHSDCRQRFLCNYNKRRVWWWETHLNTLLKSTVGIKKNSECKIHHLSACSFFLIWTLTANHRLLSHCPQVLARFSTPSLSHWILSIHQYSIKGVSHRIKVETETR